MDGPDASDGPVPAQPSGTASPVCRKGPAIVIDRAQEVDEALVGAFAKLTPQLSRSSPAPSEDRLREIIGHDACTMLVARSAAAGSGAIVGVLTLVTFPIPTGTRAWVEDVVVDESARGAGVGEQLIREAVRRADAKGAKTIDLTSRPSREAANRLYRRVGFEQRDTNVYRISLR